MARNLKLEPDTIWLAWFGQSITLVKHANHATDWHRFARYHGARGALLPTAINKCMPDTYIVYTCVYNTIQYYTTAESNLWPASWLPPWRQNVSQIPCLWPGGWCLLSLPCKSHRGYRGSSQKNNFQSRNQSFYDLWYFVSFSIFFQAWFRCTVYRSCPEYVVHICSPLFKMSLRQVILWITTATLQHPGFQQRPCCTVPKSAIRQKIGSLLTGFSSAGWRLIRLGLQDWSWGLGLFPIAERLQLPWFLGCVSAWEHVNLELKVEPTKVRAATFSKPEYEAAWDQRGVEIRTDIQCLKFAWPPSGCATWVIYCAGKLNSMI